MRRVSPTSVDEVIEVQGLKLDPVSHRVSAEEKALDMGPTEFKLLHFFMTHPERVYSREQLLNNVWGTNVYVEDRTVDVHIRRLRKAIEETGHDRLIQTVRGAGYRFSTVCRGSYVATLCLAAPVVANGVLLCALRLGRLVDEYPRPLPAGGHRAAPGLALSLPEAAVGLAVARSQPGAPNGSGSWEYIFNGIYKLQQRHRARRRELAGLIRRFREGAEALPDAAVVFAPTAASSGATGWPSSCSVFAGRKMPVSISATSFAIPPSAPTSARGSMTNRSR